MCRCEKNSVPDDGAPSVRVAILVALASLAILGSLSSCSVSAAEAKIVSPKTAPTSTPILIDGTGAKSTGSIEWLISDPEVKVFRSADNRQIVVMCGSEKYVAISQRAIDSDKKEDLASVLIHFRADEGETPQPPVPAPDPMPDKPIEPADVPVIPSSIAGKASYDAAMAVQHPAKREHAAKVVKQMRRIQAEIKSGEIDVKNSLSLKSGLTRIQKDNKTALGVEGFNAWKPWGAWFGTFMFDLYMAGKLNTPEAWIAVIEDVIKGLEAVR